MILQCGSRPENLEQIQKDMENMWNFTQIETGILKLCDQQFY